MTAFIQRPARQLSGAIVLLLTVALGSAAAQTQITAPKNKYSPQDDVKLGLEAAAEARKQLPVLSDDRVHGYVEEIGRRLANAVPAKYQHPEFRYTFEVINQKEINAFALPGGPMFVNRGMIESAKTEGEVAGVMAHELSHVVLRHGTAQATKGEKLQIGAVAGQILGAIVGGTAGSVIAQGSNFGLSTYFMKFSREYETQADLLGAQIMARAGYDPRDMANMFKTIEAQGGGGGPQWLSDHPNPGNRYQYITQEARNLRIEGSARSNTEFQAVKSRLTGMSPAYTAEQIAQMQKRGGVPTATSGRRTVRVEPPSSQYRSYSADRLRISVPANWRQVSNSSTLMYAPDGAFFQTQGGGTAFTHGIEMGMARSQSQNLQRDTEDLLQSLAQSNPQLRRSGGYQQGTVDGHRALTTTLRNVSDVTGQAESVTLTTIQGRDGNLVYLIGVAPDAEAGTYERAFRQVRDSLRLND